ncbi:MAG: hypothetical protein M3348_19615 [Acidobacteriota bacterium]|nr:hypothetical protein [Acidobacteriota bacterium]
MGVKKVSAILVISVLLIFVASLALLRTKGPRSKEAADELPPGAGPRGLFADAGARPGDDEGASEAEASDELEKALRARAGRGDLTALNDARAAGNAALYRATLDTLVARAADSPDSLRALAAHVARGDELRSSPALAERLLELWKQSPTRAGAAELLRVAALSDDAESFGLAVSTVLRAWEEGRLADARAEDLRSLFEAEYWLLSSEAKRSGAGFLLKQRLADARRRLSARARRDGPPSAAGRTDELPAQKERP